MKVAYARTSLLLTVSVEEQMESLRRAGFSLIRYDSLASSFGEVREAFQEHSVHRTSTQHLRSVFFEGSPVFFYSVDLFTDEELHRILSYSVEHSLPLGFVFTGRYDVPLMRELTVAECLHLMESLVVGGTLRVVALPWDEKASANYLRGQAARLEADFVQAPTHNELDVVLDGVDPLVGTLIVSTIDDLIGYDDLCYRLWLRGVKVESLNGDVYTRAYEDYTHSRWVREEAERLEGLSSHDDVLLRKLRTVISERIARDHELLLIYAAEVSNGSPVSACVGFGYSSSKAARVMKAMRSVI